MKKILIILLAIMGMQARWLPDINFWSGQFKEHAEFATDFTSNPKLKEQGNTLAKKFDALRRSNPQESKNEFLAAAKEIKKFQKHVDASLSKKDPDYAIKHDLIDHMNKETDYAIRRVERGGMLRIPDEVKFWNEEHEGEAKATAYFMTTENGLKNRAKEIETKLKNNQAKKSLRTVEQANRELDKAGQELDMNPDKTRMPKKLAMHEARERARAQETFTQLEAGQ